MTLLIANFAVWGCLFWHELRRNWLSWRALVALAALLMASAWLTSPGSFF
jgi:hypothetical protein